jgi:predicted nuclease of predicted toxin-antitoxin system
MIWVDAHISPAVAKWVATELGHPATSVRDLGLGNAKDKDIFAAARQANAVVMTKDEDFTEMVERLGPPRR